MGFQVAIDGPAGAGKSTISREVSRRLSFVYVDTGAMYRAIGLYLMRQGIAPDNRQAMAAFCGGAKVRIAYQDGEQVVLLNGEDVGAFIRTQEVSEMASACSAVPEVREQLLQLQRDLARDYDVVMDGRDIGTTILPEAQVKVFLTASPQVRAKRRLIQDEQAGRASSYEETLRDIIARDERDVNRAASPLRKAEDAVVVDSSDMSLEEVIGAIVDLVEKARR